MKRKWLVVLATFFFLGLSVWSDAPSAYAITATADDPTAARPEGWTETTHGNAADPNYEVVFPRDRVNQITIAVSPEDWAAMLADLTEIIGPPDAAQTEQVDVGRRNPIWVPATIEFEGNKWTNVGVRFKGESTLLGAWRAGWLKLPLRLDFDELEDRFPEINNQRFHGFKQLSLSNSLYDDSYLRDALTYDLLEEAGLVAAQAAHYEVILDHGDGVIWLGLYIMIEVIEDTVVKRHFNGDSGNIYEGYGPAASFAEGLPHPIRESFQKENNERQDDWSDLEALYGVLHSGDRITNPEAWRASLESVFDVNAFLKWLAIGAVVDHWDTYGFLPHNYYLYNDPGTGRLTWISWDHNFILGGPGPTSLDKVDRRDVGAEWPLIRYLLDDPTYYASYVAYLNETVSGVFDPDRLESKYQGIAGLLEPYAARDIGELTFRIGVQNLFQNARDRFWIVNNFLATQ